MYHKPGEMKCGVRSPKSGDRDKVRPGASKHPSARKNHGKAMDKKMASKKMEY